MKIGITGGIGSGKSYVAKLFDSKARTAVYYSDDRVRELLNTNETLKGQVIEAFGEQAYVEGKLNKSFISYKIFTSPDAKTRGQIINNLVTPFLREDWEKWCLEDNKSWNNLMFFESALIFESGIESYFDKIITVMAPFDIRLSRIIERDKNRTNEEIRAIISKQMSQEDKALASDFVINNSPDKNVELQVEALYWHLKGPSYFK